MTIIQRVPWRVQPQVPVPLDSGGLFGRRIAASYSFQFGRALRVDQQYRQITHTGKSVPVVSKYKGLSNASGGNGWSDTDDGFRVKAASSGLTVAFGFSQASIVGSCRILSNDGTGYNWWIQRGGSGNLEVFVNSALQATAAWPSSATAYHFWSVSMAAGGGTTIYLDGVLVGSGGSTPLTSVDRSLSWLADGSQIGAFYSTDLLYGVLSAQEHNAFCANPWQIYAPLPRHIWAAAAAGGGTTYTITPSGGITLAGTSVDIKGKIFLPTGGVSFAGTGGATFASGGTTYTISPTGGLTFGGTAAQVHSKTITPSGGLTLSGTGLGLRTKVFSAAGGVSLSGTGSMTSNTTVGSTQTGERTKVGVGT